MTAGPFLSVPSFVTTNCALQFSSRGIRPGLTTVLARNLDKNTVGYLQWRWGIQSAMNTSIVRDTKTCHFTVALQVSRGPAVCVRAVAPMLLGPEGAALRGRPLVLKEDVRHSGTCVQIILSKAASRPYIRMMLLDTMGEGGVRRGERKLLGSGSASEPASECPSVPPSCMGSVLPEGFRERLIYNPLDRDLRCLWLCAL